jgi:hypothetical protein
VREFAKNKNRKKTKNKTEDFHAFFQTIIPIIQDIWTDRCIDKNTSIVGGRIVAEYDSLSKKVTQLYTMKEMVLPEDEIQIFNESLETRLEDTNQQLKKWILKWKPVIDHSTKRVKASAQEKSKPIWKYFTAKEPAKGAFRVYPRTYFTKCNEMTDGDRSRTDCLYPTTQDS